MKTIALSAVPNQSFSIQLEGSMYDITIKETNGVMCATIARDGVTIVSNDRLVAGYPIIPYRYLEDGNFIVLTDDERYPYYTEFGVTQNLIYASASELETIRGT